MLSNVLAAIAAIIVAGFDVKNIVSDEHTFPRWVLLLKYAGTVAVTLTFVTESGYQGVFSTLSIENVPVQLLKVDAASGATTISFFPPAE